MLISHDRDFLDAVVGQIIAIDQQRLSLTSGGYSDYERARAARLATQQASYEAQQREIAHLSRFVERFKAKATKARQAQSRVKMLERMEIVAAAHVDSPFHFSFREPSALPDPLLQHRERRGRLRRAPDHRPRQHGAASRRAASACSAATVPANRR